MIDMEKVIKGLQCIIDGNVRCESCGYAIDKHGHHSCQQNCASDAIAMLKEQEAIEPIDIIDEKYPVGDHNRYKGYRCGNCKEDIPWDANYCLYCGRKVKWDD